MSYKDKLDLYKLIEFLRKEGLTLWEEEGKLKYKAPKGVVNDNNLRLMKENKIDIINLLKEEKNQITVEIDDNSKYEVFPLTDIQSAYLLGRSDAFEYGGVACHIYLEILYPKLELKKSEEILNKLISRHDMLRAIINKNGYQQVLKDVPKFKILYHNMENLEIKEVDKSLAKIRYDMGHRIYDTEEWPLFDVAISENSHNSILHFSIEFLIADWASIWLILSEFESLYYNEVEKLPKLELTFRDYLISEKRLKESVTYFKDKEYWMKRIEKLPSAPDLPVIKSANLQEKAEFYRNTLKMDAELWNSFKNKAQKHGITPTVAIMTAYASVIERWSNNSKFCLNLTVLNRLPIHPQVNDIVGDFTSVSLLEVDFKHNESFNINALNLSKQLFEDLDHRLFTGVEVLREIAKNNGREVSLMPVVFTSAIGLIKSGTGSQLKGDISSHGISQTPQVFIDCQAMDMESGLQINWDIRKGVFPKGMIEDMFNIFESLLFSLAKTDELWEIKKQLSLPSWQTEQVRRVNDTKKEVSNKMLHSDILKQAKLVPKNIAVIDGNESITYEELMLRASTIAKELQDIGCIIGDKVAIIMDKSVHQVASVLGILSVGAVYVPMDITQPKLRQKAILEKSDVKYILAISDLNLDVSIDIVRVDKLKKLSKNILSDGENANNPAYIIYTSGSTGEPKGVVITHRAALNTIEDINQKFNINSNDKILGLAKLSFDLSVYDIFGILSVGGSLIYPSCDREKDPSHWVELMKKYGITIWNSVPAIMQMLIAYLESEPKVQLERFRLAMLSGDWIPLELPDKLIKKVPLLQLISLGGATEASIWSIFYKYNGLKKEWSSIPYGKPLSNQGFYVLDKYMRICPVWVPGELYIFGDGLAKEYYGDKKTTSDKFIYQNNQRFYRTGDIGCYMPDGNIEFLGRQDNQVKIKGHRIELGEIESILQKHPLVSRAAVVVNGKNEEKTLFAAVETSNKDKNVINENSINEIVENLDDNDINENYANLVSNTLNMLSKEKKEKTLKVLLSGIREESQIEQLLVSLKEFDVEWTISQFEENGIEKIEQVKSKFSNNFKIKFIIFDIEKDYRKQAVSPNSFDLIFVNLTSNNLENTILVEERLVELTRSNGVLIIKCKNGRGNLISFTKCCQNTTFKLLGKDKDIAIAKVKQMKNHVSEKEIIHFLEDYLPNYMVPNEVQVVDRLPLTNNGKINRKEIVTWKIKEIKKNETIENSSIALDSLGKTIVDVWVNALGITDIHVEKNFYDYGADSLIMAQVTGNLRDLLLKNYNIDIQFDVLLRYMINNPTVIDIIKFIKSKDTEKRITDKNIEKEELEYSSNKNINNANVTFYGKEKNEIVRVVFHAGLGSMSCFRLLIPNLVEQKLGRIMTINIYDTNAYCDLEPENTIEILADNYMNEIIKTGYKEVQLIGYSLGGLIAVEVAKRMIENNIKVKDLVIIDGHNIPYNVQDELLLEILFLSNINLTLKQCGFDYENDNELMKELKKIIIESDGNISKNDILSVSNKNIRILFEEVLKLSRKKRFSIYTNAVSTHNGEKMPIEMLENLFNVFCQSFKAAKFKPTAYMGDIRLLLSSEPFDLLPNINEITYNLWKNICLGKFSVENIKGNHFTCIEKEPNVIELARKIGENL